VSIGITDSTRLNLRYLGGLLSREHTTRMTNGAMLAFDIAFGRTTPSSAVAQRTTSTSHVATANTRGPPSLLENSR